MNHLLLSTTPSDRIVWRRRATPSSVGLAHEVFLDYIEKELRAERERKALLDQRGVALVTTSGSLTTLLFALGAVISGQKSFHPSAWTVVLLTCALVTFSVSALFGLLATRLVSSEVGTPASLHALREKHWTVDIAVARNAVADVHARTIARLRGGNKKKVRRLEIDRYFRS